MSQLYVVVDEVLYYTDRDAWTAELCQRMNVLRRIDAMLRYR